MQFHSFAEFWAMGTYGFYVWLSFGLSAACLLALVWQSKGEKKALFAQIRREKARREALAKSAAKAETQNATAS